MHLKSLTLKGFKSFPERTRLDFGPGVSVVVGPNGSGKSNVTDALLWAMGEQSPLAVRGSSMQDVIFGGGRGVQARSAAEVEIVLDNSDGTVDLPVSEISIVRRLDRSGDGEYRLNGAKCRLVDVIEVLSDTGLGKETHSVISQGRVEAIVTSKPRDRRLLIEEAAGLGKHRKRRRRAQLKLERTQENLDRALDIEREARTRLRPLKRQAEAAELHERLELQTEQTRLELAREAVRATGEQLLGAEEGVRAARAAREQIDSRLREVIERRTAAETAMTERAERHDALSARAYAARSARERLQLRGEQAAATATATTARAQRIEIELGALEPLSSSDSLACGDGASNPAGPGAAEAGTGAGRRPGYNALDPAAEIAAANDAGDERLRELEAALVELDGERELELECEIEGLRAEQEQAAARAGELKDELAAAREARERADTAAQQVRGELRAAETVAETARREAAQVGARLAAANQFLRSHAGTAGAQGSAPRALSDALEVKPGYELALAAALGGRLDAALVRDMAGAKALLDRAGQDGAAALLAGEAADDAAGERQPASTAAAGEPPAPDAVALLDLLSGSGPVVELARRLLADAWVLDDLDSVREGFTGIAASRTGRVLFAGWGEVRQVAEGGAERVLARRNERDRLIGESQHAVVTEQAAQAELEQALGRVAEADGERDRADGAVREADRRLAESAERQRKAGWLIEQRRAAPEQGPLAVKRAQLEGELAAERRAVERRRAEQAERRRRIERLRAQRESDLRLAPRAERLAAACAGAGEAMAGVLDRVERLLAEDRAASEQVSAELRACAQQEAEIQAALRVEGEAVTAAEVSAQRLRDQAAEAAQELATVCDRLQLPLPAEQAEPLGSEQQLALQARLERLARRREQLGPVNPLAADEYAEALAHVQELEQRRGDLETALRELRGVIRETDRQIQETFNATFRAAARNFEELVGDVFPGGSGCLRLVDEERPPQPVLGGETPSAGEQAGETARASGSVRAGKSVQAREVAARESVAARGPARGSNVDSEPDADEREHDGESMQGVEIEITPAGKSSKRLSLLSGGEKSMTALAFLFAVFLARPCPFYVLDEVEAALDDLNLDRFLALLRRHADRAQFVVITHQKRTMEAADWLYGVSMADNGVSKVLSRRLPREEESGPQPAPEPAGAGAPQIAPVA